MNTQFIGNLASDEGMFCKSPEEALECQIEAVRGMDASAKLYEHIEGRAIVQEQYASALDIQDNTHALRRLLPIWWSKNTADMVLSAAATYPPGEPLVSPDGIHWGAFMVFSAPCLSCEIEGQQIYFHAVSWYMGKRAVGDERMGWSFNGWQRDRTTGLCFSVLRFHVREGESLLETNMHLTPKFLERGKRSAIFAREQVSIISWLSAAARFLEQQIVVGKEQRVQRAAFKRAMKSLPESNGIVRVVEMRRLNKNQHSEPVGEHVEWSCQWIVRGHWRKQWHARTGKHVPTWILPHVKGPEDKPLKQPSADVWKVSR